MNDITEQAGELERISTALADFDAVSAGIAAMREAYEGVIFEVSTTEGLAEAKAACNAIRAPRLRVEQIRKEAKAPLLSLGKRIDGEASRITDALKQLEEPIEKQIEAERQRKEAEKQAQAAAELARVSGHKQRINAMREQLLTASLRRSSSATLHQQINALAVRDIVGEGFEEFAEEAEQVRQQTMDGLMELYVARREEEQEAERLAEERRELEHQRAQEAAARAQREAIEAAERAAQEAELAAERAALRAERERQAAERERQEIERRELERRIAESQVAEELAAAERARLARLEEEVKAAPPPPPVEVAKLTFVDEAAPISQRVWEELPRPRPTDGAILDAVAEAFDVSTATAHQWLVAYDRSR